MRPQDRKFVTNALKGNGEEASIQDAADKQRGARFVPNEVTLARRDGHTVPFIQGCSKCCWYWALPDGKRTYHFEESVYTEIGRRNHGKQWRPYTGTLAGPCPDCGNTHTNGGIPE